MSNKEIKCDFFENKNEYDFIQNLITQNVISGNCYKQIMFREILQWYINCLVEEFGLSKNVYRELKSNNLLDGLYDILYLDNDNKNIKLILKCLKADRKKNERLLNTFLDIESLYNAITQKYGGLKVAFRSDLIEHKRGLLTSFINGLRHQVNTFEKGYIREQNKKEM